jgi:formylglycine-generating enzyme required for sulfatase activity
MGSARRYLAIGFLAACNPASGSAPQPAGSATAVTAVATSSVAAPEPSLAPAATAAAPAIPEGMVLVPEGIFLMGSLHGRGAEEERPAHEAIVPAFYMDRTEVTMRAYHACVAAGACKAAHTDQRFCNESEKDRDDHPVNCIDLFQAIDYCRFAGKRVPTEREWEYAARGGTEQRTFSWGEALADDKRACYSHPGGTCPVGKFAPGAFDLLDVNGNLWEWTQSAFVPYPSAIVAAEPKPDDKQTFVYRGGSWSRRFPKWLRNGNRNRLEPVKHHASLGVRCVRTVEPLRCPPATAPADGGCVRVEGEPGCEPGFAFDGKRCVRSKNAPVPIEAALKIEPGDIAATKNPEPEHEAGEEIAGGGGISRGRSPKYDADCREHWPGKPVAYTFTGGSGFHDRKAAMQSFGCAARDVGTKWTSACCKQ